MRIGGGWEGVGVSSRAQGIQAILFLPPILPSVLDLRLN